MRKRLTALLAMVVLVMMLATPAAFAAPQEPNNPDNKSRNSCGASNPNIGVPAGPPEAAKGEEFDTCGFRNNPHFVPPPGN
jgi:hypothetical protein